MAKTGHFGMAAAQSSKTSPQEFLDKMSDAISKALASDVVQQKLLMLKLGTPR